MVTVLSCANAGVTLAASSSARNAFLIGLLPRGIGLQGPLRILLYDIITIARLRGNDRGACLQAYNSHGSKYCGQK
jgi:hypothetical protein